MNHAFGISEDDVEVVLCKHWSRVANSDGKPFEDMASDLYYMVDADAVERAALKSGTDISAQTYAAHEEIERQLVERGVLSPPRLMPRLSPKP